MPLTWTDGHLDLAYLAETGRDMTLPVDALHGPHPAAITLPALRDAHVRTAFATLFVQRRIHGQGDKDVDGPWCYSTDDEAHLAALRQIAIYHEWQRANLIRILPAAAAPVATKVPAATPAPPSMIGGKADPAAAAPPLNVILLLEGAAPLRSINDLRTFHMNGVRIISLTWVDGTRYAGGDQSGGDVTPEGRELLAAIDNLAMIHDLSHLSEAAFWTVMHTARRPKIASHSNARALLPGKQHPERHLADAQIKAVAAGSGPHDRGVIGINVFTNFLTTSGRAAIADILRHVRHMEDLVGRRDFLALGSDMEGGFSSEKLPADLDHPRHLHRLAEALANAGWSDDDIRGFAHENWDGFLARTLGIRGCA